MFDLLPLAAPAALVGVALASRLEPGRQPHRTKKALAMASSGGVVAAVATMVLLVAGVPSSVPSLAPVGLDAAIRLDGLSVTMLTMVTLLVMAIGRFSATYLEGDDRHGSFLGAVAATAACVEVLVLSNHLALFWMAWVSTSVCLHRLLVFYPERPRAVLAARKKFVVARLGDAFLAGAFLVMFQVYGTARLDGILDVAGEGRSQAALAGATILLALTALLKSAQFPTHGWLVEVMETPTPVSALLHAGILNAGPFLILRFAPVMEQAGAGAWLLLVGGGFTAAFASVVLRTQPSVKVALGYSSVAHMGFMLFVCGLGVYAAAALHLVAHSFYKAHAFLSAGSTVDVAQASRVALPERQRSLARVLLGAVVASSAYVGIAATLGFTPWERASLMLVGAILVVGLTQLVGAGLDGRARPITYLQIFALAAMVTTAFFGLEEAARWALAGALPPAGDPSLVVIVIASAMVVVWTVIVAIQVAGWGRQTPLAHRLRVHLRHGLYANAWFDRLVAAPDPKGPTPSTRAAHP